MFVPPPNLSERPKSTLSASFITARADSVSLSAMSNGRPVAKSHICNTQGVVRGNSCMLYYCNGNVAPRSVQSEQLKRRYCKKR